MDSDDRDVVYRHYFDKKQRQYLRTLIDDDLIEEHRRNPRGQHSEPLERLLVYFRHAAQKGKYVIKRNERSGGFRVAQLTGEREAPLRVDNDREYATADEAYHEVFLRRVHELMEAGE